MTGLNLKLVNRLIVTEGLSLAVYHAKKYENVAPEYTLEKLIHVGIGSGQIRLKEGKFVANYKRIEINLDSELEQALRARAAQTGISPVDLLLAFARERLMPNND